MKHSDSDLTSANGLLAAIAALALASEFRQKRLDVLVAQSAGAGDASNLQIEIRRELGDEEAAILERRTLINQCAAYLS